MSDGQDTNFATPIHSSRRIRELDGLRGIAILLVLIWHYVITSANVQPGTRLAYLLVPGRLTWSGVDLFFVLSGFLIGGILLDARASSHYFKTFYIRRFCRIVPVYAMVCCLFWVAKGLAQPRFLANLQSLWVGPIPWYSYATFTQNFMMWRYGTFGAGWFGATWSLSIEEQFYLTLPLVVRYTKSTLLFPLLVTGIIAAPAIRLTLLIAHPEKPIAAYVLMPCRADALLLGVCAAVLVRRKGAWNFLVSHRPHLYGALAVLLLGVGLLTLKSRSDFAFAAMSWGYTCLAMFYVCILLLAVTGKDGALSAILRNPLLTGLGAIAYGTYLIHELVLWLCYGLVYGRPPRIDRPANLLITLIALALTIGIAKLSWEFFEKPLVRYSHKVKY